VQPASLSIPAIRKATGIWRIPTSRNSDRALACRLLFGRPHGAAAIGTYLSGDLATEDLNPLADLAFVALTVTFFALMLGFVRGLDRI